MPSQKTPASQQDLEASVLFMSIGEGAIVINEHGRISRINSKALEILGYTEQELLGKWFPETIIAEDAKGEPIPYIERPITEAFITGHDVSARIYYRRSDGTAVPVFLTMSPVLVDGRPVGAIQVFRDISDEIALEKAKDEFVAIASHQLRTPATAVKQYIGLLLDGFSEPLTAGQRLFLEKAYESNERQLNIIHEILNISKLDLEKIVLKLDLHDLRTIAKEAAGELEGKFKAKNQKLILKLPKTPVWANVDKAQIQVAIENLLENASNYSRKDKPIDLAIRQTKDKLSITIHDQGVGIKNKDIARLFQKFSRIHNDLSIEAGGTGLGLYWAAKIIELHGGSIEVKSVIGKGSRFTISLLR